MVDQILYNPYNSKNRLFRKSDIQAILSNTKFTVQNDSLYQTAMVHSSYVKRSDYQTPTGEPTTLADRSDSCLELFDESYERLEHLGDSVLGVVVSSYLFKRFPGENEGFYTNLKKEIVCNEMLGVLSQKIGLDKFYIISKHNEDICKGRINNKKLGDILEAFIGALWLDSHYNFQVVYRFVIGLIEKYINIPKILMNNRNYKDQLQKLYQGKFHYTPTYKMLESSMNSYTMAAIDKNGENLGTGTASTKKQAEQLAAKDALVHFPN
jgi:ribonuclease III